MPFAATCGNAECRTDTAVYGGRWDVFDLHPIYAYRYGNILIYKPPWLDVTKHPAITCREIQLYVTI